MPAGFTTFDPAPVRLKQFVKQPKRSTTFHLPCVLFPSMFSLKHYKMVTSNEGEEVIL